ncbi:hypothetical protein [Tessaracoccus palaemonis]|uniref:Uncharacterized protein n=1 Tax=Tessaracoccus palaemonis TaxID=2829499 RepID=A0ABX8SIU6_9ACTN|nr:hypothetical protein [Tessaracoccus palaemonis]QXT62889.1 hypothetical protein KDB89_14370 [Tessaracoccus palaemonis]
MATDENTPRMEPGETLWRRFLALPGLDEFPVLDEPGDLTRAGIETMVASQHGSAREMRSSGQLRFTGDAVPGHRADLDAVAHLSSAWQKSVTATGAALEGIKSIRGKLPAEVVLRTRLVLSASPARGSVVFLVEPKQLPMEEVEPGGNRAITPEIAKRPLADLASESLVELLAATHDTPDLTDELVTRLRDLGPRVGSAVGGLARAIEESGITLDVAWREPTRPTRRAIVKPFEAKYLAEVVEGRGLNAMEETLTGQLATISNRQQWALQVGDRLLFLDMGDLGGDELTKWNVDDLVEVTALTTTQERPDGRVSRRYTMMSIRAAQGTPTVLNDEA